MKHVARILSDIEGISIYPIIGLIIFFTIFVLVLIYVFTSKKEHFKEAQHLPLDEQDAADFETK